MTERDLFKACGGKPIVQGDGTIAWNFGIVAPPAAQPTGEHTPPIEEKGLYQTYPALQGRWDGKTTICHHNAARRVLGRDLAPHQQPRGTCGGRAGSRGLELLQCVLIAAGKRAKFKYVSHAWPYYLARREAGMLGPSDGVPGGSIAEVLSKYGALTRDECGDREQAGERSDDLAVKWGRGAMPRDEVAQFEALARDNIVTARVRVRSAAELADGLAGGGIGICSDDQGYEMQRDGEGFCRPRGVWYHYHVRSGVGVSPRGRKYFAYDQSWGKNCPTGPVLPGWPDNCFAVDWDVQDAKCRSGEVDVVFGFELFELEQGEISIPWSFL